MGENQPVISLKNVSKEFPGVKALTDITMEIQQGEVHVLIGENGAGKSTLIKIISGVYKKDGGEIYFLGKKCDFSNAKQALKAGISVIHQELSVIPDLSVAENIYLGREIKLKSGFLNKRKMNKDAQKILDQMDVKIKSTDIVKNLSSANKQMVEIAKAVSQNAKLIIMDEPTSSISEHEVESLFHIIRRLRQDGVAVIYISHRLSELFEIGDNVTVLRDGCFVKTAMMSEMTEKILISLMVGREIRPFINRSKKIFEDVILEVKNASRHTKFANISLKVMRGEVVGIAGLVGAGRTEVLRSIFGAEPLESGDIMIDGKKTVIKSPRQAIEKGLGLVPEDRRNQGVMLGRSVKSNLTLPSVEKEAKRGFVDKKWEKESSTSYIEKLSIKTPGEEFITKNLSGGNQQKIVIAKWLLKGVRILLLDEPTRGIDVGAKREIYQLIDDFTSEGGSVLVVSSELPELIGICDRIYVMCEGKVTGELSRNELTEEAIMELANIN